MTLLKLKDTEKAISAVRSLETQGFPVRATPSLASRYTWW
jgi:hypothetical protein